ncbi:GNAT family N-acetyltransferase [Microbacterium gorillae]|uniref:GNAT family N-acetyltransferase n=1 Tax=Microbacterium gorillae TaxID=1231063 RepID=UPI000B1AD1B4|nr:GNAT family N-acetyltransferase [Microbacterium gorillae]
MGTQDEQRQGTRPMLGYGVRPAEPDDLDAVRALHNHWVRRSTATLATRGTTAEDWERHHAAVEDAALPFHVAVGWDDEVLGYALLRPADSQSPVPAVQDAVFVAPFALGCGIGAALLGGVLRGGALASVREVVAVVPDAGADAALALHERFGFAEVGRLRRITEKFGRRLGVIQLQRTLDRPGR